MIHDEIVLRRDYQRAMGLHPDTIRRQVLAGVLPQYDFAPSLKRQGWHRRTLEAFGLLPPANPPTPAASSAAAAGTGPGCTPPESDRPAHEQAAAQ